MTGRAKHIYSIYQKMSRYSQQSKSFDQMHLTAEGNRLVGERLAGALRQITLRHAS